MADVYIRLEELERVLVQLDAIIDEFDHATSNSEEVEAAIGDPFDHSRLRDRTRNFEERWDDKRGQLKDDLGKVRDHVKDVVDGFTNWDTETASQISPS